MVRSLSSCFKKFVFHEFSIFTTMGLFSPREIENRGTYWSNDLSRRCGKKKLIESRIDESNCRTKILGLELRFSKFRDFIKCPEYFKREDELISRVLF